MPNREPMNAARTRPVRRRPNALPQAAERTPARRSAAAPVLDQAFDRSGLLALRSAVAAYAAELGAGRRLDDVVLIAHELSSNAIRHGGGAGRLRLWRDDQQLMCRVSDSGPGLADAASTGVELPAPQVPGGRGLWLVRRLATVRIDTGPDGTVVTAAVPLR